MAHMRRHEPELVTLDLGLPPDPANATEGLALLEEILAFNPGVKVIVVTGNDDRENALKAVALGAYDFYIKPVDAELLRLIVDRAARLYELEEENRRLARGGVSSLSGLITADPRMLQVCRMVERVAPSDATVLLLGDSGTGKEVLARAVHDLSNRAKERFVAINCAAIPENLLESELFGYEKGAFTGATRQTIGKMNTPTRARCSWTRSAIFRRACRPSSCAFCRSARSSAWAGATRSRWMCASSVRPIRTSRR